MKSSGGERRKSHPVRWSSLSRLTLWAKEYLASSDAQLLYWSPTYGAVLVFHVWTHRRSVATLLLVQIEELVFSIQSDSLSEHKPKGIVKGFSLIQVQF